MYLIDKNDAAPSDGETVNDPPVYLIPPTLLKAITQAQGVPIFATATSNPFPIAEMQRKKEEEALKNPVPGQLMPDGTIYLGRFTPEYDQEHPLKKTFNAFAAPEDLPQPMSYNDTADCINWLKDWHGYNGTKYRNYEETYHALKVGDYDGGWIIPPLALLNGTNAAGDSVNEDCILKFYNIGSFQGTFEENTPTVFKDFPRPWDIPQPGAYWSSTQDQNKDPDLMHYVVLPTLGSSVGVVERFKYRCRPIRLEEIKL